MCRTHTHTRETPARVALAQTCARAPVTPPSRITGLTLSKEQLAEATKRVDAAGLGDRITLLLCDYRWGKPAAARAVLRAEQSLVVGGSGLLRWSTGPAHHLAAHLGLLSAGPHAVPQLTSSPKCAAGTAPAPAPLTAWCRSR